MTLPDLAQDTPATELFPQFESEIYQMIATEIEGLTEEQLDFESDQWEWSKWSIRRNLSHMASGDVRWLVLRWGEQLFPNGAPDIDDLDGTVNSPYDRRLDENKYWAVPDIMAKLREGLNLSQSVLTQETVGSLLSKEIEVPNDGARLQFSQAHPRGIRVNPDDSSLAFMSLEATFRHRYFEYLTHVYNIQRLKRAQGLTARVEVPFEGYWALPDWDRSEP